MCFILQDGGTLPVGISENEELEVFIPLMCRKLPMTFEKEVEHDGIETFR